MTRERVLRGALCVLVTLAIGAIAQSAAAGDYDAGAQRYRLTVDKPQEDGVYTVCVNYQTRGGTKFPIKAEADIKKEDSKEKKAEKIVAAIQAEIDKIEEASRGIEVHQGMEGQDPVPEVWIKNLGGFKITSKSIDDGKTNEKKDKLEPLSGSFGENCIDIAIDVYGVSTDSGAVELTIGEGTPISVHTPGKTAEQIEEEIGQALTLMGIYAYISSTPLIEDDEVPFDGSEIHLPLLDALSYTVGTDDPGLGMRNRAKFLGQEASAVESTSWGSVKALFR